MEKIHDNMHVFMLSFIKHALFSPISAYFSPMTSLRKRVDCSYTIWFSILSLMMLTGRVRWGDSAIMEHIFSSAGLLTALIHSGGV